jgi:hypothetical protein
MAEVCGIEDLRQSLGKRSKITLTDRLRNIGKNIGKNPFSFILPIIAGCFASLTIHTGNEAQKIVDANRGYSKAYRQVVKLDEFLKTDPTFYVQPPVEPRALDSAIDNIRQNLKINTNNQAEVSLYLTERLRKSLEKSVSPTNSLAITSTNSYTSSNAKTNNLSGGNNNYSRKSALEVIIRELTPLNQAENGLVMLAVLSGLTAVISGICCFPVWSDANFEDYNSRKKGLRQKYKELVAKIKSEVRGGNLSEDGSRYVGKFFMGLDLASMGNQYIEGLASLFSNNAHNKTVDLFRVLSENPRAFVSDDFASYFSWYHNLRREDRNTPLTDSQIQSRKDLFLKLLGTDVSKDSRVIADAISFALKQEAQHPAYAEALVKGKRDVRGFQRATAFLAENGVEFGSLGQRMVDNYLLNPDSLPLISNNLGCLSAYANRRITNMPLEEAMRFLLEVESFETGIKDVDKRLRDICPSLRFNDKHDDVLNVAIQAAKEGPEFGAHALTLGEFASDYRAVCPQIYRAGFIPNEYLIQRLLTSKDREAELASWRQARDQIRAGQFNPKDKLMRSLEYTTFYRVGQSLKMPTDARSYKNIFSEADNE